MRPSERGFTLIELLVAIALVALIAVAATMATFQVITGTERNNNHMTVIRQVQNAGFWISQDALMAESVITDNLTPPDLLTLTWTEWGYGEEASTYHLVTYSFQDLSDGIGKLKRQHLIYDDEGGVTGNTTTLVAQYIYYNLDDPDDPDNPTAIYQSPPPVLTVQIASSLGEAKEIREYRVWRRPNF